MSVPTTAISWCDATWNPLRGCSRVSTGCEHCYAEQQAGRFSGPGQPYEGLVRKTSQGWKWTGEVRLVEKDLEVPLRWKKPRRIFVNSMSDLFHESVPEEWIDQIFAVMTSASRHQFQVLTKRPERMHGYVAGLRCRAGYARLEAAARSFGYTLRFHDIPLVPWPIPSVWLGVSCEDQATADARIPWLLQTPAAVRFVSYEPALDAVDFRQLRLPGEPHSQIHNALTGVSSDTPWGYIKNKMRDPQSRGHLDWVICGGESGPKARPTDLDWLRYVAHQCQEAGVPVFCKQLGAKPYEWRQASFVSGPAWSSVRHLVQLNDRKGADPAEWPDDLRVQQFPEVRV